MRHVLVTLGAVAAWLLTGHLGLLAILVYVWASAMTSTTNTAKTRAVEKRVNAVVAGQTANNQAIQSLQQGNFDAITVTGNISCSGSIGCSGTYHCGSGVLGASNFSFLSGLSQIGPQPSAGGDDENSGSTWASGERGYINNAINAINSTQGGLINHGFMAS